MTMLFGQTRSGEPVHAVDLGGGRLTARVLTLGAILNDVRLDGRPLTLGARDVAAYEGPMETFGSLIGPVVNRIRGARAMIAGRTHHFETNFEGAHTLHSGADGTHRQVWRLEESGPAHALLSLELLDGLGGFPGHRRVRARYSLAGDALTLEISAESDAPTLFSFANHSYWALDGEPGFAGHTLTVPAGRYLQNDASLMPTGRILDVEETEFDARRGVALAGDSTQFFDLNYCFCEGDRAVYEVARLRGKTGLEMTMESTAPGLQVYDCATIEAPSVATHHGAGYGRYAGLALEAQRWPGALEHPHFSSIAYPAGRRFHQVTRWTFSR
ncbi:MAG: aldose epimerase family protein [Pseudomonadota bacterium]